MIATIRPNRAEIYINSAKKTLAQVKKETGCTHIMNGGSFDNLSTPNCQLKVDGKVYVDDGYKYWGYAWDDASDFGMCVVPCKKRNYIALIDLLRDGHDGDMDIRPAYDGCRQRTAIGTKADGSIVLYCTLSGRWPTEVKNEMAAAGCLDAVLLDSGLSSQCNFNGWVLEGGRKVHNFLLFWTDKAGNNEGSDTVAELKKGSQGAAVKAMQAQLVKLGFYVGKKGPDGDFGSLTETAVKSFQKDMGFTGSLVDGRVGPLTQEALDMACTWETCGNALVLKAGHYLGVSEPDGDNQFIDKFSALAGATYGHTASWCQMFAVDCMDEAELNPYITASCTMAYTHYQAVGAAETLPKVGYLIYLDWDKSGDCDHVGIVSAVGGGYVYVIEGNSAGDGADAVRIKRYLATNTKIRGYADPAAAESPTFYIVKLTRAGAERLSREYGGEIVKYQ